MERARESTALSATPSAAVTTVRTASGRSNGLGLLTGSYNKGRTSASRSISSANEGSRSSADIAVSDRNAGIGDRSSTSSSTSTSNDSTAPGSRPYDGRRSIRSSAAARGLRGRKRLFIGVDSPFKGLFTDGFVRPGATESVAMESYMYFPTCGNKTKKGEWRRLQDSWEDGRRMLLGH